ncbi:hypothetical protein Barb6XT_00874 [Bacteroidales bacterium Barb6XT]|nr:hypothetical protein Barb6XT_00874 [Bacteroidales bacterium Barb6XT]
MLLFFMEIVVALLFLDQNQVVKQSLIYTIKLLELPKVVHFQKKIKIMK